MSSSGSARNCVALRSSGDIPLGTEMNIQLNLSRDFSNPTQYCEDRRRALGIATQQHLELLFNLERAMRCILTPLGPVSRVDDGDSETEILHRDRNYFHPVLGNQIEIVIWCPKNIGSKMSLL
ncbi:hypothetical protein RRG08_017013 [Elysia crispata]|uniref:Uncharacterized protein n=1 Tax=Elysia crispata TaxID=231223 RepID=A0AAE0Y0B0_9GAST|nr:hypothetical protein RRG08_017013 [Elysia crispata]